MRAALKGAATLALALAAIPAAAQGVRYDNQLLSAHGLPVAGANVEVCTISTPAAWAPSNAYSLNATIRDSNGLFQKATTAGTSGTTQPTWSKVVGATTADNTVTWTNVVCTPAASIWSDRAETVAVTNPTTTSSLGNYGWFASPGSYFVEIYGSGLTTQVYTATLPCDSSLTAGAAGACASNLAVPITIANGGCNATTAVGCLANLNGASKPVTTNLVQFVTTNGSNTNDGLSWGTAKMTLTAAYGALPGQSGTIKVACGAYTMTATISIASSLRIESSNRNCVAITVPTAAQGPAFVDAGASTTLFELDNVEIKGNGAGSQLVNFTKTWPSDSEVYLTRLLILNFPASSTPIISITGNPYFVEFSDSISTNNQATTLYNIGGGAAYFFINDQVNTPDSYPGMEGFGYYLGGDYQALTTASTQPDILVSLGASGISYNPMDVEGVRFGPENESATHVRIKIMSTGAVARGLRVTDDFFEGNPASTVAPIELDASVSNANISQNGFLNYPYAVNDAYVSLGAANLGGFNSFGTGNWWDNGATFKGVCVNGCVGFNKIEQPKGVLLGSGNAFWAPDQNAQLPRESPSVSNYVGNSETYSSWSLGTGTTIAGGQTDPYGTTRAGLITFGTGATAAASFATIIFGPATVFYRVWLRGGTATAAGISLKQGTVTVCSPTVTLTSSWQEFSGTCPVISGQDINFIYINGTNGQTAYVFGPEVSQNYPSDYVPTTSAAVIDTTSGVRLERNLELGASAALKFPGGAGTIVNTGTLTLPTTTATLAETIASGTAAMTTAAIAAISGSTVTCGTTVTVAASGVLSTDAIIVAPNAAEGTPNTGLRLSSWPTAGNVNFAWCNPTASSQTPVAETLNWRVVR